MIVEHASQKCTRRRENITQTAFDLGNECRVIESFRNFSGEVFPVTVVVLSREV